MKKLLLICLLSTPVFADVEIQRVTSEQLGAGYAICYVEQSQIQCMGMPDNLDQAFISSTWMSIPQTSLLYGWPVTDIETSALVETYAAKVPRVVHPIMFQVGATIQRPIPIGTPCEGRVSDMNFLRAVTYGGYYGFAICSGGL